MLALFDTETQQLRAYPRVDDHPVDGLDPRFVVVVVVTEPAPEHNPSTQQLRRTETIDLAAGEVRYGWAVDDLPPPAPQPQWERFKGQALSHDEINGALAAAMPFAPGAVMALPAALMAAAQGAPDDFRAAWLLLRRRDLIPQKVLDAVTALAADCNLPEPFVRVLGGAA